MTTKEMPERTATADELAAERARIDRLNAEARVAEEFARIKACAAAAGVSIAQMAERFSAVSHSPADADLWRSMAANEHAAGWDES